MSTTSLATLAPQKFIIRPLGGQNQVYDNVPPGATVRDLKERIFVADGVPIENQKLIYGPEPMDDARTLESYNIREGFVIRLLTLVQPPAPPATTQSPAPVEVDDDQRVLRTVFIRSGNGSNVTMSQVRLLTTVEEFREQYSRKQGQDADHCRLIFSGKELQDVIDGNVMTLRDYNVQNESTLHEVFRLPGGL